MRQLIISVFIGALLMGISIQSLQAQSKEAMVLERVQLANATIFGTKDSATLNNLLAKELTYGHSGGVLENRKEALHNATTNANTYANTRMEDFSVFFAGDAAIVRYVLFTDQVNKNSTANLKLGMLQVWVKEKGKWKMAARQAVKLQ